MKQLLWACVLALPLLALPTEAKAWHLGSNDVDWGAKVWFNVTPYPMPQAGPWYLYWPYEAHFQVPAPGVSPYFPPPMTLPPGFGQPPPAMAPAPQGQGNYRPPMPAPQPGAQPMGYSPYGR